MPIIETRQLSLVYGEGTPFRIGALHECSVSIEQGEFLGIIGHTGSGKSTLVQLLNGLLKPTSGEILLNGCNIWEKPKEIRRVRFEVGLVFQYPEYQLFDETVYKDIAFGPINKGLSGDELDEVVHRAAQLVGIDEKLLQKSPFDLSGGEKRRAAIAGVIAMQPKVLILDEPTAGLDPRGRELVLEMISEYRRSTGCTVLLVSHSMEDVAKVADRVLVMNEGRAAMLGTVREVFARSQELYDMGLRVPQVTEIFLRLKAMGYDVNTSVYTVEQAERETMRLLAHCARKGGER